MFNFTFATSLVALFLFSLFNNLFSGWSLFVHKRQPSSLQERLLEVFFLFVFIIDKKEDKDLLSDLSGRTLIS